MSNSFLYRPVSNIVSLILFNIKSSVESLYFSKGYIFNSFTFSILNVLSFFKQFTKAYLLSGFFKASGMFLLKMFSVSILSLSLTTKIKESCFNL